MKKLLFTLIILLFLMHIPLPAYATEDYSTDSLQSDIYNELENAIDKSTLETLKKIGISDFDFDEIYNISFNKISSFFSQTLKEKSTDVLNNFFRLFSVVLFAGIVSALFSDYTDDNFSSILSSVIITMMSVNVISDSLNTVVSVLQTSGKFMLSFAPAYTLIISMSGNTASALTYNTFAVFFAEIISTVISTGAIDFIGCYFCLGISFSMNESINVGKFTTTVNRIINTFLGFIASVFTGYLSLRNILSVSVDRVSVRSIRFLISSLIPVVGSSISEAYSSLLGSINLIKSSVAIVGILVILIINTPIIIETLAYYISFNILSYTSDILSANKTGDIFRIFSSGIRILLLLCIFEMFIMIISIGIILSVKSGG